MGKIIKAIKKLSQYLAFNIVVIFLFLFLLKALIFNQNSECNDSNLLNKIRTKNSKYIKLIDLNRNLEPFDEYNPILCRSSKRIYITTTLCIHNPSDLVSGVIWKNGNWEDKILRTFLKYLNDNPSWLVLDIGANLGVYTLYSARMGRNVVSVEPFYDNQIRIHKASKMENIQDRITLIGNALSDKRNELKRLKSNPSNVGAQSLMKNKDEVIIRDEKTMNDKYIVETILFDDIVPYLPKNEDGNDYKEAIMKIDIESFEPYAFQHADKLFNKLKINIIYMEWVNIRKQKNNPMVGHMLDLLYSHDLSPFYNDIKLEKTNWTNWPLDIIWKRENYY